MVSTPPRPAALVHLRAAGTSLLLDLRAGRLPVVVHWGGDLGPQSAESAAALALASIPPIGTNQLDVPVQVAALPEHSSGYAGRPGLSGSRRGQAWSPRFTVTGVSLDGDPIDGFREAGPAVLEVDALDTELALRLNLTLELATSGLLRTRAAVTNEGEPYQLDGLTLALPVPARADELLDFAGRWGREKTAQRRAFTVGTHLREGRKGRTGADAAGVLHAGTPGFDFGSGEVWAVHTGWSGNHVHYAERCFDGNRLVGGGELLLPGEVVLEPGATYESPWVFGAYGQGLDEVAHRFHDFLRSRPRHPDSPRKVTLNVWEAVYFDHDLPRLLDLADRAAAVGVERLVLDDGWFGARRNDRAGLGDWVVAPDVWPQGLHPLVQRVHDLGMEFGLWVEPEMVNPDSEVARAHPEWVLSARHEWPIEARHQQVLNLAVPGAYAHVRDQLLAILDEYDIAYLKWDHNRDLVEAGDQTLGGRPSVHAQTAAAYRLMADLKAAHPGLEIESCSSGGARVDLGVMDVCDRIWVSDCIDPGERQRMMQGTTQLLPLELCGAHVASGRSHTTGRTHDLGYRAATALFGHFGIEWDLAAASAEEIRELGGWIRIYQEHRELLHRGDLIRVDTADEAVIVHGVVAPDRSDALFAYVLHDAPQHDPPPRFVLRGLDRDRLYTVSPVPLPAPPSGLRPPPWWAEDSSGVTVSGSALLAAGLQPPVVHPDQAVLLRVRAADRAAPHPREPR